MHSMNVIDGVDLLMWPSDMFMVWLMCALSLWQSEEWLNRTMTTSMMVSMMFNITHKRVLIRLERKTSHKTCNWASAIGHTHGKATHRTYWKKTFIDLLLRNIPGTCVDIINWQICIYNLYILLYIHIPFHIIFNIFSAYQSTALCCELLLYSSNCSLITLH